MWKQKKQKMPHLLCLLSWRQMGLPVFKSIFWLTALFCTEKDHEWHWKRVCTHARSSCQSLQTRGGEDVPTGHQFCYFHLGKSEKSKTRCILEYGISDTEKSVNMFSSLPQKPAEVCKILGLCSSCDKEQMLSYFAQEALQAAVTSDNVSEYLKFRKTHCGEKRKTKQKTLCWTLAIYVPQSGEAFNRMLLLHLPHQDFGGFASQRKNRGETRLYCT